MNFKHLLLLLATNCALAAPALDLHADVSYSDDEIHSSTLSNNHLTFYSNCQSVMLSDFSFNESQSESVSLLFNDNPAVLDRRMNRCDYNFHQGPDDGALMKLRDKKNKVEILTALSQGSIPVYIYYYLYQVLIYKPNY